MKAEWEKTDPAKSENTAWTAQTKSEILSRINDVLAHPDGVLYGAVFRWALWLTCVGLVTLAGITAWRNSIKWPWLALAALLLELSGQAEHLLTIHQGVEMGRPSLLHAGAKRGSDGVRSWIGGGAVPVLSGVLQI